MGAFTRREAAGAWSLRGRRGLEHGPGARHHVRQRHAGRSEMDALLGHLMDERQQGLLLLALSRTSEKQGARGRAVGTCPLLPPDRHAAVDGYARVRKKGPIRL